MADCSFSMIIVFESGQPLITCLMKDRGKGKLLHNEMINNIPIAPQDQGEPGGRFRIAGSIYHSYTRRCLLLSCWMISICPYLSFNEKR
jgi:hypothetical protein